jgi:hypothetical protein
VVDEVGAVVVVLEARAETWVAEVHDAIVNPAATRSATVKSARPIWKQSEIGRLEALCHHPERNHGEHADRHRQGDERQPQFPHRNVVPNQSGERHALTLRSHCRRSVGPIEPYARIRPPPAKAPGD